MPPKKKCALCLKKPKTQNNSFVAPNINSRELTPKPKPNSSPKTPKPKPKSKSESTPLPKPSPNSNSENSNSEYLSLEQIQEKISKLKKKLKNFPKPNNGIPTNNMVRVMAELTILTSNALEKLEQKRKTMTSRINKLKGKKVVRRLNFNK